MIACEDVPRDPSFQALAGLAHIDLRYATTNNFVQQVLYGGLDRAYLRTEAVLALQQAATRYFTPYAFGRPSP
jgi:D-alanyl-D-alanine dipeptidase